MEVRLACVRDGRWDEAKGDDHREDKSFDRAYIVGCGEDRVCIEVMELRLCCVVCTRDGRVR